MSAAEVTWVHQSAVHLLVRILSNLNTFHIISSNIVLNSLSFNHKHKTYTLLYSCFKAAQCACHQTVLHHGCHIHHPHISHCHHHNIFHKISVQIIQGPRQVGYDGNIEICNETYELINNFISKENWRRMYLLLENLRCRSILRMETV